MYGSSQGRAFNLRQWSYGKLRVDATPFGIMLPRNTLGLSNANDVPVYPGNELFLAGGAYAIVESGEDRQFSVGCDLRRVVAAYLRRHPLQ